MPDAFKYDDADITYRVLIRTTVSEYGFNANPIFLPPVLMDLVSGKIRFGSSIEFTSARLPEVSVVMIPETSRLTPSTATSTC
jgi:hypothetical protein